jgi:rhodanese-related sulfurtransferase
MEESGIFENRGLISDGMRHLSATEAVEAIKEGALLVDVRPEPLVAMKAFAVEGVINCEYFDFEENLGMIPKDKPVILADAAGLRSKECMKILLDKGYTMIANLAGGIMDWERDGMPVIKNPGKELNGPCLCMLRPGRH